jgi:8-amino-7-oxononanoate synthase
VSLEDDVRSELAQLEAAHRLRVPRVVDGPQGPRVTLDGVQVLNLASNDYLSLAADKRVLKASATALEQAGSGAGASRLIVGNHRRHISLEEAIADWLRVGGVRLFNSGYAANVGTISTLVGPDDVVFSDELNHASIIDGCRLSRAQVVVYPHCDLGALEALLGTRTGRRRVVISETLFSMDGDIVDVEALSALSRRHDAALYLDEAHAVGTWGPEGRGIAASAGVIPDVLVGTCGKALGGFGAFVATTQSIAQLLWNRARSLVFSTGLPPSVAAGVQAAIEIVRSAEGAQRRGDLTALARELRSLLPGLGGHRDSAIAPLVVGDDRKVMQLTAQLLERRIYAQGIRPPTVPEGTARLRISLSSGHTSGEIAQAAVFIDNEARQVS